ncbi:hypothetical protein I302_108172 [Kwoniella bestiolae CBS 10118]|uniref:Mid2 domain-containing protein n=1 Tax=Kwoniella bestiolae CBS 10118 TaxID=1296100 RepID=A0A1B9FWH7_9TREE|nr:hypothetical protein I302_07462 [Kwoniella bestiolae CBS 10118]OCF23111.1 hypothetical protein I302_07462 [Kwoniella bestiolae CBS 10118]
MNITIDDASPQWQYYSKNNTWLQDHTADDQTKKYFKQTFMGTFTEGDSASLRFNGTAIIVYGAKRFNHGYYSTQLDGGTVSYQNGYSRNQDIQQVLFQAGGLDANREHVFVIANTPSKNTNTPKAGEEWWLDIDFAVITTAVQDKVYSTTYDDGSSAVSYFGDGWAKGDPNKDYYNTTAHVSAKPTDLMRLQFNGSSIQIFGGTYTDHGNYSIVLDDGPEQRYNGTFFRLQPQVPLYTANNLQDGPHTLTMINVGTGPKGNFLDFDYAVVNSTIDPSGSSNNNTGTNTTISDPGNSNNGSSSTGGGSSNVGAIAGGVAGGVVGLALVVVLAWFLFRRRNKNKEGYPYAMKNKHQGPMDLTGEEVKPFQHNDHYPLPSGSGSSSNGDDSFQRYQQRSSPNGSLIQMQDSSFAREMDHTHTPFLSSLPAPPPSSNTSYPRSVNPPSSSGRSPIMPDRDRDRNLENPFSVAASSATFGHGHDREQSTEDHSTTPTTPTPTSRNINKTQGVSLPFTALPPIPSSEDDPLPTPPPLREREHSISSVNQRMYVPGREQDMGPLPLHGDEEDEQVDYGVLPPDYHQATEPLPGQRPTPQERGD